jgi:DNA-binding transcriptional regulator LsrR (DeoR family)
MTLSLKDSHDQLRQQADKRLQLVVAAYSSGMRQIDISRSMDIAPTIVNRIIKRAQRRGLLS